MRRYELSDEQYELIKPLLPKPGGVGRPWANHRQVMNGLFWKLSSGASWRDIPERYGPWQTIYERYTAWRADGTWERIVQALQVKLDATGQINWTQWNIDSTLIRASHAAGGARKKGAQ
jgi:transposase